MKTPHESTTSHGSAGPAASASPTSKRPSGIARARVVDERRRLVDAPRPGSPAGTARTGTRPRRSRPRSTFAPGSSAERRRRCAARTRAKPASPTSPKPVSRPSAAISCASVEPRAGSSARRSQTSFQVGDIGDQARRRRRGAPRPGGRSRAAAARPRAGTAAGRRCAPTRPSRRCSTRVSRRWRTRPARAASAPFSRTSRKLPPLGKTVSTSGSAREVVGQRGRGRSRSARWTRPARL